MSVRPRPSPGKGPGRGSGSGSSSQEQAGRQVLAVRPARAPWSRQPRARSAAAQNKLLGDQQNVDGLLAAVAADLRSGTSTCSSLIASLHNLSAPAPRRLRRAPRSRHRRRPVVQPVPDPSACTALLNKVLADQQSVTTAQNAVGADETALTNAVATLVTAAQSGSSTPTPTPTPLRPARRRRAPEGRPARRLVEVGDLECVVSRSSGGPSRSTGGTSGSGTGSGGTLVTAQMLVLDQATIDADAAGVTLAQQSSEAGDPGQPPRRNGRPDRRQGRHLGQRPVDCRHRHRRRQRPGDHDRR